MDSFYWNYRDHWLERETRENREKERKERKNTRLVIDEDSIYEIDLDCIKCREKGE